MRSAAVTDLATPTIAGPSKPRSARASDTVETFSSNDPESHGLIDVDPVQEAVKTPSSILSNLLLQSKTCISALTSECLELLQYHKSGQFMEKSTSDLSGELSAVKIFVEQWCAAQLAVSNAGLTSSIASNLYRLSETLNSRVSSINVFNPTVGSFLSKWGVKNVIKCELDDGAASRMGIQAFLTDDAALESELAVIDDAVNYRLSRWMASFPVDLEDIQWPTSFTAEEKKEMRNYVRDFLDKNKEMWAEDRSREDQATDVAELRNDDNFTKFPVTKGKAASVIQQVLKDVRNTKHRSETRSQSRSTIRSERSESSSSIHSQSTAGRGQKRRRVSDEEEHDDSDGPESNNQGRRSRKEPMRGRTRRRGSPLKYQLTRKATEEEMLEDEMLHDGPFGGQDMDHGDRDDDDDYILEEA
jgi:hypothetical protein